MTAPSVPADLITVQGAANLLKVHPATCYRLIRTGGLRAWKRLGGRVRVSRADVLALLVPVVVRSPLEVPPARTHESEAARLAVEELRRRGVR